MKAHLELRGWNLQAQKRLFYIATETYQANNLGSNRISFSMVNREPWRAWTVFPVSLVKWSATYELSFPKDSISAARLKQGSSRDRACLQQEIEKLKENQIGYITPS